MNVLIVTRGYPTNENNMLGIFELDQAKALKKIGHRVAYVALDIRSIRRKRKFGYNYFVDKNGIEVFEMSYPVGNIQEDICDYIRGVCFKKVYSKVEKQFGKPDIIHSHFLKIGNSIRKYTKQLGIPFIHTEHLSLINSPSMSKGLFRRAQNTYRECDALITVSNSLSNCIKDRFKIDSVIINNIVNVSENQIVLKKVDRKPIFVAAGNLIQRKGFDLLIQATAQIAKEYPDIEVKIFGEGEERQHLEKLIDELSLKQNIKIRGRYKRSDLSELYSDAIAFVLASRRETFGVVYVEAMALGLPVIATNCGGPEEFVNKNNGYLIEVDKINQLSKAMTEMILNWEQFNRTEISKYTYDNFSDTVIAKQITDVYEKITSGKES